MKSQIYDIHHPSYLFRCPDALRCCEELRHTKMGCIMSPAGGGRVVEHFKLSGGGGLNGQLIVHPICFISKYFHRPDSYREGQ